MIGMHGKNNFIFFFLIIFYLLSCNLLFSEVNLEISGIVSGKNNEAVAIINGEILRVGDKIGDVQVVEINSNFVKFREGKKEFSRIVGEGISEKKTSKQNSNNSVDRNSLVSNEPSCVVYPEDVASVTLRLFYDSGAIHGYVIFRNRSAEMCAVKFAEPASLVIQGANFYLGRIEVSDFRPIQLKGGDVVLAHEIESFVYKLQKDQKAQIGFEWGRLLTAQDEVGNFLDD